MKPLSTTLRSVRDDQPADLAARLMAIGVLLMAFIAVISIIAAN